jgi:hypothetical protein
MCHFGTKTISSRSHFKDNSSPHISGSGSMIQIDHMFVLFKHVILMWINYLETWLRSDNTSYYYTFFKNVIENALRRLCPLSWHVTPRLKRSYVSVILGILANWWLGFWTIVAAPQFSFLYKGWRKVYINIRSLNVRIRHVHGQIDCS